jgi:hypothetical protein
MTKPLRSGIAVLALVISGCTTVEEVRTVEFPAASPAGCSGKGGHHPTKAGCCAGEAAEQAWHEARQSSTVEVYSTMLSR